MTATKVQRPTDDIRRRLLAGEPLTTRQCASDYGCSTALLGSVVKSLRDEGVTVGTVPLEGGHGAVIFQVVGAEQQRESWGKARGVRKLAGRGPGTSERPPSPLDAEPKAQPPARRSTKRNGVAVPALPSLGADVSVCLLAVGDDGRISIGFRSDAGTWLTSVDGFSAND